MPFIAAGEITTHYALEGPEGAPVLLLANSLGTSFHVWDEVMAALAAAFRVLRYDMRGHGLTDATPLPADGTGYSIPLLAADALALLDALGIGKAHVCGLSIGGMVAQHLAATAPARVDRLVLCDTSALIGPASVWDERIAGIRRDGLAAIAPGVMGRWFTDAFRQKAPQLMRGYANMVARTTLDGYLGCAMAVRDADLRAAAATITAPHPRHRRRPGPGNAPRLRAGSGLGHPRRPAGGDRGRLPHSLRGTASSPRPRAGAVPDRSLETSPGQRPHTSPQIPPGGAPGGMP